MNNLKNKYEIILGTVTLIISYSAFKDQLSEIVIPFSTYYNLLVSDYIFYCIIGFSFSLYLYVIEKLFSDTRIGTYKVFDYIILIAYSLFTLIILSPILLVLTYITIELFVQFKELVSKNDTEIVDDKTYFYVFLLFLLQSILMAVKIGKSIISKIISNEITEREEKQIIELEFAIKLHNDKYFCHSIVESFKLVESIIKTQLISNGKRYSNSTQKNIEILKSENLITPELYKKINDLRKLRNEIVHSSNIECTEENSSMAIEIAKEINHKFI